MMTTITTFKYFTLLIVTIPGYNCLIDIRHRFELSQIPTDVKEQILTECKLIFDKFYQTNEHKVS